MGKDSLFTSSNWVRVFRVKLIAVSSRVLAGKSQMMLASWEGGIRGRWPKEEYVKMTEIQEEMITVLSQVCVPLISVERYVDRVCPSCSLAEPFGSSIPSGSYHSYITRGW